MTLSRARICAIVLTSQTGSISKFEADTRFSNFRTADGSQAKMPFVDARAMAAATGITSTVEDMAKFVSLQFRQGKPGGNQILSTGALRQMHRVRMLENNWQSGNAIGFAVTRDKEKFYVGHGGSYFGYKTQTLMQMDPKVGVIVLTNADDANPNEIALHLMQSVGEAVAKASRVAPAKIPWDSAWSRFAGTYRSRIGGEVDVIELNQRLLTINPSGPFQRIRRDSNQSVKGYFA